MVFSIRPIFPSRRVSAPPWRGSATPIFIADSSPLSFMAETAARRKARFVDQEETPRERALYLLRLLVFGWRPTEVQVLWALRIIILLGFLLLVGHAYHVTLWDWLDLLIVPVTIAAATTAGAAWFTRQREQDAALQTYLDKMSELLVDKELHEKADDTRVTARARTLTVLRQLDGRRKRNVLLFLREA